MSLHTNHLYEYKLQTPGERDEESVIQEEPDEEVVALLTVDPGIPGLITVPTDTI